MTLFSAIRCRRNPGKAAKVRSSPKQYTGRTAYPCSRASLMKPWWGGAAGAGTHWVRVGAWRVRVQVGTSLGGARRHWTALRAHRPLLDEHAAAAFAVERRLLKTPGQKRDVLPFPLREE